MRSWIRDRISSRNHRKQENGFQMRAPHGLGSFILCLPWITAVRRREGEWWSSLQQIFCSERKERLPLLAGGRRVVLINQHDRARILKSNLKGALTTGNLAQLSSVARCGYFPPKWLFWKACGGQKPVASSHHDCGYFWPQNRAICGYFWTWNLAWNCSDVSWK